MKYRDDATAVGLVVVLALGLATACQPQTELEPVEDTEVPMTVDDDVAVTRVDGVTVRIDGGAWQGDPVVLDAVSPVYLEIANSSDVELVVEYSNFELVGATGVYEALPVFPYDLVDGEVVLIEGFEPVTDPSFTIVGFRVAPLYAPVYPGVEQEGGGLVADTEYYARHLAWWNDVLTPTAEMQVAALPQGVLPAGASAAGFLFFEKVSPGEEKVNFMGQIENASERSLLGTVRIPLAPEPDLS